jgi:hypothetical protein
MPSSLIINSFSLPFRAFLLYWLINRAIIFSFISAFSHRRQMRASKELIWFYFFCRFVSRPPHYADCQPHWLLPQLFRYIDWGSGITLSLGLCALRLHRQKSLSAFTFRYASISYTLTQPAWPSSLPSYTIVRYWIHAHLFETYGKMKYRLYL